MFIGPQINRLLKEKGQVMQRKLTSAVRQRVLRDAGLRHKYKKVAIADPDLPIGGEVAI